MSSLLSKQVAIALTKLGLSGDDFYLAHTKEISNKERNALIRAEFNGRNLSAVCRKYDVSERTVYRACRRGET